MTLPPFRKALSVLPAPLLVGLAGLALFAVGRCTAPGPTGPSKDSASAATYAKALDSAARVSASRDSARNAVVDSLLGEVERGRARLRQRPVAPRSPVQPVSTSPDSVRWLVGRLDTVTAERDQARADLDSVLTADSVSFQHMARLYRDQQEETARLRDLLAGAADSLRVAAIRIGTLERRDGCHRVLGIPLPELGAGYGLTVARSDGRVSDGLTVALQWRIGCIG